MILLKKNNKDINDWNQAEIQNRNKNTFIWRAYLDLSFKQYKEMQAAIPSGWYKQKMSAVAQV